ncbi:hypothetical protein NDU88_006300 [Pleurodeles waltl]|uniref:Uncharacterized protein n=1 Tax=Pleurodeles waltl TaxID=8319 RepID=A0AAV7TDS0_PLEWA|nr:hypothetical protein NDU88_006300 [Pleurodeles waltl]
MCRRIYGDSAAEGPAKHHLEMPPKRGCRKTATYGPGAGILRSRASSIMFFSQLSQLPSLAIGFYSSLAMPENTEPLHPRALINLVLLPLTQRKPTS